MKIAFVIGALDSGGAQRVMVTLANRLVEYGEEVFVITVDDVGPEDFFAVDQRVKRIRLDVPSTPRVKGLRMLRQIARLRQTMRRLGLDVVVSFITRNNVLTIIAGSGQKRPIVISDRQDPRAHPLTRGWRLLRRLCYPRASALVFQTNTALDYQDPSIRRKSLVIPNPVPMAPQTHKDGSPSHNLIVALGRLNDQKGFDMLIRAFASICQRHPAWSLDIWGEGPERTRLESLVAQLGLEHRVRLPGTTTDPYGTLSQADLFVLSSRREGFPNALCEAMACGVPVIAFDCPSGPRDIVRDQVDGLLIPSEDVGALAIAMERLIDDDHGRHQMAARTHDIVDRFSEAEIVSRWRTLLETLRP